jgi:hypothetical protein
MVFSSNDPRTLLHRYVYWREMIPSNERSSYFPYSKTIQDKAPTSASRSSFKLDFAARVQQIASSMHYLTPQRTRQIKDPSNLMFGGRSTEELYSTQGTG